MAESLTTKFGVVTFSAGNGALTVAATKTFSTTDQALIVTADDITIEGDVSTGSEGIVINCETDGRTVGLGSTSQEMTIEGAEFGLMTCTGFSIGSLGQCGSQVIGNITKANTENIGGIVSLLAIRPGAGMTFTAGSTTFNTLNVQADAGISVEQGINSIVGKLHLDSDADNSDNLEVTTDLTFSGNFGVSSANTLTLEATQGTMTMDGALTLFAGSGVVIQESLQSVSASVGNPMVINADYDSAARDGTLTLFDTKRISTNQGQITITAWDIDLSSDADLDAGSNLMKIFASGAGEAIGFGEIDVFDLHLSDSELQHITAGQGLELGSSTSGTITVDGITDAGFKSRFCILIT